MNSLFMLMMISEKDSYKSMDMNERFENDRTRKNEIRYVV